MTHHRRRRLPPRRHGALSTSRSAIAFLIAGAWSSPLFAQSRPSSQSLDELEHSVAPRGSEPPQASQPPDDPSALGPERMAYHEFVAAPLRAQRATHLRASACGHRNLGSRLRDRGRRFSVSPGAKGTGQSVAAAPGRGSLPRGGRAGPRRIRSVHELRRWLSRRGYPDPRFLVGPGSNHRRRSARDWNVGDSQRAGPKRRRWNQTRARERSQRIPGSRSAREIVSVIGVAACSGRRCALPPARC